VVIGGGSGFVGSALVRSLAADGHEAVVVSRDPAKVDLPASTVAWKEVTRAVAGADAVVNLAGLSVVGPRWTSRRKEAILVSRVQTTNMLVAAIEAAAEKPRVFVSASGIDYAGDCGDAFVSESAPAGDTFLARVCAEWEAAGAGTSVRHVVVRTPFVVGPGAKAVRLMAFPFRLLLGGALGSGAQWFPWIHVDDLVRIYRRAVDDESLEGPVNAVAPQKLRQREAAADFGAVLHRPAKVPTPAFVLRAALGEQADLMLHGQRAVSTKLGVFEFRYRAFRAALGDALR